MAEIFRQLRDRGLIAQMTSEDLLREERLGEKLTVYIGFDLTAPNLHVGSLIQLVTMRRLIEAGHTVWVLLGEATTKVGDPSGKDKSRPMLTTEEIETNRKGIEAVIRRLVPGARITSNSEWFNDEMSFISFLRDYGPHFTINRMNTFDTVRRRLEAQEPMTFLEFTYMLLQAVDFLKLFQHQGCTVQMGGSDQWGNIVNGVELVRRVEGETVFGVTTPLLTDKHGKKMGKSVAGAVWLDASLTPPFDFFQFWRNVEDEKVEEFFLMLTDERGDVLDHGFGVNGPGINAMKELLAFKLTKLVHGEEVADQCLQTAHDVFRNGGAALQVTVEPGEMLSQLMVRLGFAEGRNAARRLLAGNAVTLGGDKIIQDMVAPSGLILRVAKKHTARLL